MTNETYGYRARLAARLARTDRARVDKRHEELFISGRIRRDEVVVDGAL